MPKVPETLLKKRKQNAEARAARARSMILQKKKQQETKREIFKRAEKYVREYKRKEQDLVRLRRVARKHQNFYVPAQSSLAFVVRIRGYLSLKFYNQKQWTLSKKKISFSVLTEFTQKLEKFLNYSVWDKLTMVLLSVWTKLPLIC